MIKIIKKSVLISFIMLISGLLFSQTNLETGFTTEGVETVTENTEILIEEPLVNKIEQMPSNNQMNMNTGIEIMINSSGQQFTLPINYRYKKITFSVLLPYYLNRKMSYSLETAKASGFGDAVVGLGYGNDSSSFRYYIHIDAKLPTGDDGKMDGEYLIPLGTGSTDFMFYTIITKKINKKFIFSGNFAYKLNGSSTKIAEVVRNDNPDKGVNTKDLEIIKYTITNGNFLNIDASIGYLLKFGFSIHTDIAYRTIGSGNTDKYYSYSWNNATQEILELSNKQEVKMVDFRPNLAYRTKSINFLAGMKLPLYTKRNEDNLENNRGVGFFFKIGYNIF